MKKFTHSMLAFMAATLLASALIGCGQSSAGKDKELNELRQLAEMDRKEMENQYAEFAAQYGEMKKDIKDDSLVMRLDAEQQRAEKLLRELKDLKTNSAAEILRLKKELATVRAVLRDYIRQVDSLQQINALLTTERDAARADAERTRAEKAAVNKRNSQLTEQVAVAAQLNATGVSLSPLKKNGKAAKRSKDITRFSISFTVTRNVTAATGNRTAYVRLLKPGNSVVNGGGTFTYENKTIPYSATKSFEYTGEEQRVQLYVNFDDPRPSPGIYKVHIFVDNQMIGEGSLNIEK